MALQAAYRNGEQRWYARAAAAEQVSFSWRTMLPRTGGRGSYGHRQTRPSC